MKEINVTFPRILPLTRRLLALLAVQDGEQLSEQEIEAAILATLIFHANAQGQRKALFIAKLSQQLFDNWEAITRIADNAKAEGKLGGDA